MKTIVPDWGSEVARRIDLVAAPAVATDQMWVVLYAGDFPLRFHRNLCGQVFEIVPLGQASGFASEILAYEAAVRAGVRHFTVRKKRDL